MDNTYNTRLVPYYTTFDFVPLEALLVYGVFVFVCEVYRNKLLHRTL